MSVSSAFDLFRRSLELDEEEKQYARAQSDRAREKLLSRLEGCIRTFLSGSSARHTRLKPLSDVDIIAVVESTAPWSDDPVAVLEECRSLLKPLFPGCRTRMGAHAMKIYPKDPPVEGFHLDIVVGRSTGRGTELVITEINPAPRWLVSDPEAHAKQLSDANAGWGERLVPMIKMVKHWNRRSGDLLPPFLLECLALRVLGMSGDAAFAAMLATFFTLSADAVRTPTASPAVPNGFVDEDLGEEERREMSKALADAGRQAKAALEMQEHDELKAQDLWHDLFGDPFPEAPSPAKAKIATALSAGTATISGGQVGTLPSGRPLLPTRSYGDGEEG